MGYRLAKAITAYDLASALGLPLSGQDGTITGVSAYGAATAQDLTFNTAATITDAAACVPIVGAAITHTAMPHIVSPQPRLDFIRALAHIETTVGFVQETAPSVIHRTAVIGDNVVIEPGCHIGEGVRIAHNVVVHAGSKIGSHTIVRAGAVIGAEGFGFARLADGTPVRFIHLAGVSIGQNVEIGTNNTICRGTLQDTVIEDHVKMDSLVHIGHNCHIETGAFITACAEFSGGVRLGENAWVGPNSSILEKVKIGARALVGIGSVVTKDVAPDTVVAGNPARVLRRIS